MKPKPNLSLKTLFLGISILFVLSQVDGNSLEEIMECQEFLKGHLNYSNKLLTPISAQFASPYFHGIFELETPTNEPDSLADIERKEEIKVRLTMQEFQFEIDKWWKDGILVCINNLARDCAKEPMKSEIESQKDRVVSLLTYYKMIIHSYAKINATEMFKKIAQDKKMLTDIETTQVDLCASGDIECQDCLEEKADRYYTRDVTCDNARHWHIIKYKPIRDNQCRRMRHTRVKEFGDGSFEISFY